MPLSAFAMRATRSGYTPFRHRMGLVTTRLKGRRVCFFASAPCRQRPLGGKSVRLPGKPSYMVPETADAYYRVSSPFCKQHKKWGDVSSARQRKDLPRCGGDGGGLDPANGSRRPSLSSACNKKGISREES